MYVLISVPINIWKKLFICEEMLYLSLTALKFRPSVARFAYRLTKEKYTKEIEKQSSRSIGGGT